VGTNQQKTASTSRELVFGQRGSFSAELAILNTYQDLWWQQTRSDHSMLVLLRRQGAAPCHQLHYLQMVTEKLGKGYFWRTGHAPRKSHASFVRFLQALDDRPGIEVTRIAGILGFGRAQDFENWIPTITPLAYQLERLAPDLAGDNGPNTEYPWPHGTPNCAPISFEFPIWKQLTETGRGRQLLNVIDIAVRRFPEYA
jgi:hypothetical protein